MKKKTLLVVLLTILTIGIVSLYTTFAYDENNNKLEDSDANYNLIYSIKEKSNREVVVGSNEEKYIDITLSNPYNSSVKYGMYYYLVSPSSLPDGISITLSEDSTDSLEDIIKPNQTRVVTLKITNNSSYQVEMLLGALVGFEKGKIEDLAKNGETLIK